MLQRQEGIKQNETSTDDEDTMSSEPDRAGLEVGAGELALQKYLESKSWVPADDYDGPRNTHSLNDKFEWVETGESGSKNLTQDKVSTKSSDHEIHLQRIQSLRENKFLVIEENSDQISKGSETANQEYKQNKFATVWILKENGEIEIHNFKRVEKKGEKSDKFKYNSLEEVAREQGEIGLGWKKSGESKGTLKEGVQKLSQDDKDGNGAGKKDAAMWDLIRAQGWAERKVTDPVSGKITQEIYFADEKGVISVQVNEFDPNEVDDYFRRLQAEMDDDDIDESIDITKVDAVQTTTINLNHSLSEQSKAKTKEVTETNGWEQFWQDLVKPQEAQQQQPAKPDIFSIFGLGGSKAPESSATEKVAAKETPEATKVLDDQPIIKTVKDKETLKDTKKSSTEGQELSQPILSEVEQEDGSDDIAGEAEVALSDINTEKFDSDHYLEQTQDPTKTEAQVLIKISNSEQSTGTSTQVVKESSPAIAIEPTVEIAKADVDINEPVIKIVSTTPKALVQETVIARSDTINPLGAPDKAIPTVKSENQSATTVAKAKADKPAVVVATKRPAESNQIKESFIVLDTTSKNDIIEGLVGTEVTTKKNDRNEEIWEINSPVSITQRYDTQIQAQSSTILKQAPARESIITIAHSKTEERDEINEVLEITPINSEVQDEFEEAVIESVDRSNIEDSKEIDASLEAVPQEIKLAEAIPAEILDSVDTAKILEQQSIQQSIIDIRQPEPVLRKIDNAITEQIQVTESPKEEATQEQPQTEESRIIDEINILQRITAPQSPLKELKAEEVNEPVKIESNREIRPNAILEKNYQAREKQSERQNQHQRETQERAEEQERTVLRALQNLSSRQVTPVQQRTFITAENSRRISETSLADNRRDITAKNNASYRAYTSKPGSNPAKLEQVIYFRPKPTQQQLQDDQDLELDTNTPRFNLTSKQLSK